MRTLLLACAAAFLFVGCPKTEPTKTPEAAKPAAGADAKTPAEAAKPAETK